MHHWDPERYTHHIHLRLALIQETVDLLQLKPGQRVLDVGCGEGTVTRLLLDKGLVVTGIDRDPQQVRRACDSGVDARVMDAMAIDWQDEFDAVFSNWCFHWIEDHPALFRRLHRALKPGGQLVAEHGATAFGAHRYFEFMDTALTRRGMDLDTVLPRHFTRPDALRHDLETAGFEREVYMLVEHRMILPGDFRDTVESIFSPVWTAVGEANWPEFMVELEALAAPTYQAPEGHWFLDFVRHRYRAVKR